MNSNDYMPTVNSLKGRNKEMNEKLSLDEVKEKVQEMLDEAERNSEFSIYYTTQEKFSDQGAAETCEKVLELLKKVEQHTPVKPVVPQAVADWFEENKDDLDNGIWEYLTDWKLQNKHSDFYKFMYDEDNKPIETLIRMQDGYTVEKEKQPTWLVKFCFAIGDKTPYYCINGGTQFCLFDSDWTSHREDAYHFTDKEQADMVAKLINGEVVEEE